MTRDYDAVALYSGGTDSTLAPIMAKPEVGNDVLLLMVDLGESEDAIRQANERAKVLGWDFQLINGVAEFAQTFLAEAIQFRANYWGYPLGTPMGRAFQCAKASEILGELHNLSPRTRYLVHGCSASQNTRFRIERSCRTEDRVIPVGPLVTDTKTRAEKILLLGEHGIVSGPSDEIARDENIFCRALEGDGLNNLRDPDSLNLWALVRDPHETPDQAQSISLTFEGGIPVALDGNTMPLHDLIMRCRTLGAEHGIGRICMFEDTIPELGFKERSLFEAPASVLLARAHQYIEASVLPKTERELMRRARHEWADLVYRGFWWTTQRTSLRDLVAPLQAKINGTVALTLWKGNAVIGEAEIPGSLMIQPGEVAGNY